MTRKKEIEKNKEVDQNSFLYKYKNDKKFKAKTELIGYGIFILIIIIYINISSMNSNFNYVDNSVLEDNNVTKEDTDEENSNLLEVIDNNYLYDINIDITLTNEEVINYKYNGKSNGSNIEINKVTNEGKSTFYKIDDYYYESQLDNYVLTKEETIYDYDLAKYIELDNLLEYIDKASLDYVTDYSSGKNEYSYNLLVRDIVANNKTEDAVSINVTMENEVLFINVDYSNLIKIFDDTIKECKINFTYSDIDKVEEFKIIDNIKNNGEENE